MHAVKNEEGGGSELCFGAKYGKFLAAQKLPNLETLSCLQVVATFGNIEICQKLIGNHKVSKSGNYSTNQKFPK